MEQKLREQYCRQLCWLSAVVAVVLAVLRVALTPIAFGTPLPYGIALGLTGAFLVALLVLGSKASLTTPGTVVGGMARALAACAAVVGAALVTYSTVVFHGFAVLHVLPYPGKALTTVTDQVLLYMLVFFGFAAGALFLILAVCWWHANRTERYRLPLLSLAPVAWIWVRLVRYITSYISALSLFRNLYELGTIVFELLFFMLFARYVSGVYQKGSRFVFAVSLCTGLLCAVSGIAQVAFFLTQNSAAFETCALVVAPDFGVAVFAFVFAVSQSGGFVCEEEEQETTEEEPAEPDDEEDGDGAEFLLSDTWFEVQDPEEDD